MNLPSTAGLVSPIVGFLSLHPWIALSVGVALGLAVPTRIRRIVQRTVVGSLVVARWTLVVGFWLAAVLYMLPLGVLFLGLHIVGIPVVPGEENPPSTGQLLLPLDS